MDTLLAAIYDDDLRKTKHLLTKDRTLAEKTVNVDKLYENKIVHWLYKGDKPMHLAAAGYRTDIIELLLAAGANPNSALSRRKGTPLHYAADGFITGPAWEPKRQVETIKFLLTAGSNLHMQDSNGATALHRAVRTRCAEAVQSLLEAGSDPTMRNRSGSTAFHLAVQNTGRGGTGAEEAKAAQRRIVKAFLSFEVEATLTDGNGKSVEQCARSEWIRKLLSDRSGQ